MKKIITIWLMPGIVEGDKIERDVSDIKGAPIGAPANDIFYAQLCQSFCVGGVSHPDPEKMSNTVCSHIAPAQIKTVTIEFRK